MITEVSDYRLLCLLVIFTPKGTGEHYTYGLVSQVFRAFIDPATAPLSQQPDGLIVTSELSVRIGSPTRPDLRWANVSNERGKTTS